MNRTTLKLGVAAVIASVALAGCGSSSKSSSSTPTTPAITKADFLAKGNAICGSGNAARNLRTHALGNNPTRAEILNYVEKDFIPSIQATIDQIRALGAPAGDQATVTGFLNLAQADLNKAKAKPLLIANGPGLFHGFALKAHAYGLSKCAKNA